MAATLAALPDSCRLILLGDRDQLASVEAGNLFGDLCGEGPPGWSPALTESLRPLLGPIAPVAVSSHSLADSLVVLRDSHRFQPHSGIGALARAINSGEPETLAAALDQPAADLAIEEAAMTSSRLRQQLEPWILPLATADSPRAALAHLGSRRILCALRQGPAGVEGINQLAATLLRQRGIIAPGEQCYRGMPILILRNDYGLGLFNGDTGVLWPDDHGSLQVWFPMENDDLRPVGLARLPAWQTSYALTVHKAQGSEFDRILLLLPSEDAPILNRELLYTGLTRARSHLTLCGRRGLLVRVMARRVIRFSGLGRKLGDTATPV
jgi:exodeoxyribonuclease V alpha subunit